MRQMAAGGSAGESDSAHQCWLPSQAGAVHQLADMTYTLLNCSVCATNLPTPEAITIHLSAGV
jgi:hypothetical protein